MIDFLENAYEISIAVLLLCSLFYVRQLKKTKKERGLSSFERVMYVVTQIVIIVWLGSFLILTYGVNV
ncbi:MAG: hypothetical protein WAM07_14745 [Halobacillus sp.]|uniref:hypothetical protein n=1 Tax=Halobacillus sp. TaxID=56800 RepID=UPI003BAFF4B9